MSLTELAHVNSCLYVFHRHHKSKMVGHQFVYVSLVALGEFACLQET